MTSFFQSDQVNPATQTRLVLQTNLLSLLPQEVREEKRSLAADQNVWSSSKSQINDQANQPHIRRTGTGRITTALCSIRLSVARTPCEIPCMPPSRAQTHTQSLPEKASVCVQWMEERWRRTEGRCELCRRLSNGFESRWRGCLSTVACSFDHARALDRHKHVQRSLTSEQ